MSNTAEQQQAARNIGGVIGRAIVRALRIDEAKFGKSIVDQSILNLEIIVERGRAEGARTVAVTLAYQFNLDDPAFNADEFYELILNEAYRTQANEFNKARVGTTNYYQAWINDHPWHEYSTK